MRRFDKTGVPIGSYRTLSPAGAPLSAKTILVEPDRLLLGTEAWGIFDFVKPEKAPANSSCTLIGAAVLENFGSQKYFVRKQ